LIFIESEIYQGQDSDNMLNSELLAV